MGFAGIVLLDPIKLTVRSALSGRAWSLVYNQRTAMTTQNDFGKEVHDAAWAAEQRTLHGLQSSEAKLLSENHTFRDWTLTYHGRRSQKTCRDCKIKRALDKVPPRILMSTPITQSE